MVLKRNVIANFVGRGWTAATYLALTPFYIRFMGIEAFGLVGFFLTLVAMSSLLELGLSSSLNRELARLSAHQDDGDEPRQIVRVLEVLYWGLASLMGLAVILLASVIAEDWLSNAKIRPEVIRQAIVLMGLVLTCQWPIALYSGGLLGLQRQIALNVCLVVMMTVRNFGAVLVLWLVSPTIQAFFAWQLAATALHALVVRELLFRSVPGTRRKVRFRLAVVSRMWRFAAGLSATSLLVLVLTQMDRVVLSRILSLENFGYYTLAALVGSGVAFVFLPIFQAVFPQLCRLVALSDDQGLTRLYHQACQLVAVIALPVAMTIALFSPEIMLVWTGESSIAARTQTIVTLLVIGTALNGLMNIPYALMLAQGWTRLVFNLNLVAVLVFLPLLIVAAQRYGAAGAAGAWVGVNASYVVVGVHLMHRRLLTGEERRWQVNDVGLPLLAVSCVVVPARLMFPSAPGSAVTVLLLLVVLAVALISCAFAAAHTRRWMIAALSHLRRRWIRSRAV